MTNKLLIIIFKGGALMVCLAIFLLWPIWKVAICDIYGNRTTAIEYRTSGGSSNVSTLHHPYTEHIGEIRYRGGPNKVSTLEHPHAGARDADGYWNYVPDVTYLRRKVLQQLGNGDPSRYLPLNPKLMKQVCQVAPGLGDEGPKGYKILHHVQLNGPNPVPEVIQAEVTDMNEPTTAMMMPSVLPSTNNLINASSPRILCVIYTHDGKRDHLRAIGETWGWRCDGFFAASTQTVPDIAAVDLPHRGAEEYKNMWQKTRSILAFLFDNYMDDYDYFHVAGDDTHVIVENLRNYLHLLESMEGGRDMRPLYLGLQALFVGRRKFGWEPVYNLGGPGYILNRLALRRLVTEALPTCRAEEVFFGEDLNVARCLYELGIFPVDTADVAHRQRFFNSNPAELAVYNPFFNGRWKHVYKHWAKNHGWRVGLDLVSTQAVAFHHLKSPVSMRRHHAIIYNSCPVGTFLRDAVTEIDAVEFPLEIGYRK
jgi:hypothetical protein